MGYDTFGHSYPSNKSIEETCREHGPWYLLILVNARIWKDRNWPISIRAEATKRLYGLANAAALNVQEESPKSVEEKIRDADKTR